MSGRIYLLNEADLVAMDEQPYDSEDLLQKLLADYPDLLAGEQINTENPRRWLLVTREMAVQGEEEGSPRWSLDHLFLDQDAVPTLVEVKKGNNTDVRRKVVGQMLDYAANAVVYWPVEEIRSKFEGRCEKNGEVPEEVLAEFLGEQEPDDFWQQVKTNLQAGRIRMVFLADVIPSELRRIVEFMNEQMDPAEVLAIEIKQYVGKGMQTLVPRVLGQTESARQKKSPSVRTSRQWDEPSFFENLTERRGTDEAEVARKILNWANRHSLRIWWGQGKDTGSFFPMYDNKAGKNFLFSVWSSGYVEFQFQHMKKAPFSDKAKRIELAERLSAIPEVTIPVNAITRRPSTQLQCLLPKASLESLLNTFEWVISEIKAVENRA